MTQTLNRPEDTGARLHADRGEYTQPITWDEQPPALRRPDAHPFDKTAEIRIPQTIAVVEPFGPRPTGPSTPLPQPSPTPPPVPVERVAAPDETAVRILLAPVDQGDAQPVGYIGRHRADEDAEPIFDAAPTRVWPNLIPRLLDRVRVTR